MNQFKNEHFDIVSELEHLIKPEICPDWATAIIFMNEGTGENFTVPFNHLKIFEGETQGSKAFFLEITHTSRTLPNNIAKVMCEYMEYPTLRLSYGVPNRDDPMRRAKTYRAIHFKECLQLTLHSEVGGKHVLYLSFRKAELATQ